jgi:hypothetical protein
LARRTLILFTPFVNSAIFGKISAYLEALSAFSKYYYFYTFSVNKAMAATTLCFDGSTPAVGTTAPEWGNYVFPPLQNIPGKRDPELYDQILNQFAVGVNPRYKFREGGYWCNIFLWDVSRAMGAEIPHWISEDGEIAAPNAKGATETTVNDLVDWMFTLGVTKYGWKKTTEHVARQSANEGKITVILWKNITGDHGHAAVMRPNFDLDTPIIIAQAGLFNFNHGRLEKGFGTDKKDLLFFYHD